MNYSICTKCGWVHFTVSTEYVQNWLDEWKKWSNEWTEEDLNAFGLTRGKTPSPNSYYCCFFCGEDYINTRELTDNDYFPEGSTIQPILKWDQEKLP